MLKIYTIGVYGSTEESFFRKLTQNNIDLFCDIRQRRGVRGSQYKYVNSNYLQSMLQELNIGYLYIKDLAPTNEIRQKQKDADKLNNETKKQRQKLGDVFSFEYQKQILSKFDLTSLISEFEKQGVNNVVLFCVEEFAEACHRSLVAQKIAKLTNCEIINL
jgi:uncharacterized protein (DUF488 family)